MATIPRLTEPLPRDYGWKRSLSVPTVFRWLKAGWNDFLVQPVSSLAYGVAVFAVSLVMVAGLFKLNIDYILFPALSGFMIFAPVIALGLYEKSRRLSYGEPVNLLAMIFVRPRSGGQVIFTGVLLMLLMLLWMRAAVILYALFFGLTPFPGLDDVTRMLFATQSGGLLLFAGTAIGGLFAAFSFAISVFSLPMLLNERTDALTAMGTSLALVWNNLFVMIVWGLVVLALTLLSIATAFLGLIVAFPVLGHATWHAYRTMRQDPVGDATVEVLDGA